MDNNKFLEEDLFPSSQFLEAFVETWFFCHPFWEELYIRTSDCGKGMHKTKNTSQMKRELQLDSKDIYHKYLKFILPPLLALYAVVTFFGHHKTVRNVEAYVSTSRDVGLAMSVSFLRTVSYKFLSLFKKLKEAFPTWLLNLHSFSALILTSACLFQKQSVIEMANSKGSNLIGKPFLLFLLFVSLHFVFFSSC